MQNSALCTDWNDAQWALFCMYKLLYTCRNYYFWEGISLDYHLNHLDSGKFSHYHSSSQNVKYLPIGFVTNIIIKIKIKKPKSHIIQNSKLKLFVRCTSVWLIWVLRCHLVEMNEHGEQKWAHRFIAIIQLKTVFQRLD